MPGAASNVLGVRVGVYVDGFNLYGGRGICGRGVAGWRWLDLRALMCSVVVARSGWTGPFDVRVVFCTARIKGADNAVGQRDQDTYLRALRETVSYDHIEFGTYVTRCATAPLAVVGKGGKPVLATSTWPVMVRDSNGNPVTDAWFMASVAKREEKGSDVNVAVHLLQDVLLSRVDAVVMVSNDSDLKVAVDVARARVPVGLVNPTKGYPAGVLNAAPTVGVGGHWWYQLVAADFLTNQLPTPIGRLTRPSGW
jgi:hypothetical protein